MADEKKDSKPPEKASTPSGTDPFVEIVSILVGVYFAIYVFTRIVMIIRSLASGDTSNTTVYGIREAVSYFGLRAIYLRFFIYAISALSLVAIIYIFNKLLAIRTNERKLLYPIFESGDPYINPHWQNILDHIESKNENDWRLAILEADIMLSELLEALSLPGDTIGEKLKAVEESDFTTLQNAWEAHKIRNSIAHEGVIFTLNQREARRVIDLYRTVFEEFQMI